jgi:hypothetical protein
MKLAHALVFVALALVILIAISPHTVDGKSKDSKSKSAIIKAVGKATEVCYSCIKLVQISKSNVSSYITVYNTTKGTTPVPPPNPPPIPVPVGDVSKVCLVGDLKGSTVPNMMKGCNYKIGLGDLGYASDLSYFKSLNFNMCVIGNHDSPEDGSSAIYQEALAYCRDHWSLSPTPNVLILGFNTNGDQSTQLNGAKQLLSDTNSMANVKTVIFVSHKAGHVPPNSHHPAEAKSLYTQLEALVPSHITLFEIVGHNHVSSSAPSKNWYQAGAGGKSFYSCGTDAVWTFCDNSNFGYLELTIDNTNGNTAAKFIK